MERQVVYRDRQELQSADLDNTQTFVDEALQHIVRDAVTTERQIVGLTVTGKSATELEVSAGRLWVGDTGTIYRLDAPLVLSMFGHLPIVDRRWLAVAAIGQEVETDTQPRDFLIDLQTLQTEPRVVAMERRRQVAVIVTPDTESPEPQKPLPPTGQTLLAYVLLNPTGIVSITDARPRLPQVQDHAQRVSSIEAWRSKAEPAISTLSSDVAAIAQATRNAAQTANVRELALDVARLKESLKLPDTLASYAADYFLTADESATADPTYNARVEEGVRMPWAAQTLSALSLFNPLESGVVNKAGLLLPAYTTRPRLSLIGALAGSLALNQYQFQTYELRQGATSRTVIRYGPGRTENPTSSQWWQTGQYDPYANIFTRAGETYEVERQNLPGSNYVGEWQFVYNLRQIWYDTITEPYWYGVSVTTSIQGSLIAQTVLNSQAGWLTGVGLYFTERAAGAGATVVLCEATNGLPDLQRIIASKTLSEGALQLYPTETVFEFDRPVFVSSGRRYAVAIITSVAHKAALISGDVYAQGTLMYSTDGAYYLGDQTKDLMMRLHAAQFSNPVVQIQLQPLSLAGGIADIALHTGAVTPETTTLVWEYQYNGLWYRISPDTAAPLLALPAMLPLRVSFVGTADLAPALELQGSTVQVSRPAASLTHWSIERTLTAPTTSIEVQILLGAWDAAKHSCTLSLRSGATTYTPASVVDSVVNSTSIRRKATFTINAPGISSYQVKIAGTSTTVLDLFYVAERIDIAF